MPVSIKRGKCFWTQPNPVISQDGFHPLYIWTLWGAQHDSIEEQIKFPSKMATDQERPTYPEKCSVVCSVVSNNSGFFL